MNNLTIPQFLEATASDSPVPGGGSVSALCGALGSALATMVCRLTLGRKRYADHEPRILEILDKVNPAIASLNRAIEEDSDSYRHVMAAMRLPKDTDEQKAARRAAIGAASLGAAMVPMRVAETALEVMRHAAPLVEIGNSNAITDLGVAVMNLRTAVLGACFNVRINLYDTGNADAEADLRARCDAAEAEAIALSDKVYATIHSSF